ncbi:GDSL esterase/lipase [Ananas comosus]|uniref:GDSL esterase/lipase n=1 Tax=Ananas comosus TaxID=4615 RepID=A0A199VBD8_ANACO|nr:GDSL esterase/lipase [Ananas comosus]
MPVQYLQWLLYLQLLLYCAVLKAGKVPSIIVFGDSTVDAGNNDYILTLAKSNFKPYGCDLDSGKPTGRFCNGRLATDFISEAFGLPPLVPVYLDPAYNIQQFASGVCFASAATGYDNATSRVLSVIPLWKQLEYFKEYVGKLKSFQGEAKAQETLINALYVMSLGTNDFIENYFTLPGGRSSQFTVPEYEDFLLAISEGFVRDIHQLGARKLDLTGLPPMGCLPLERVTNRAALGACNEEYNKVAREFNVKLLGLVRKLNEELDGMEIVYGNVYDLLDDVVRNPASYGFENAVSGCCGTGLFEVSYICNKKTPITCDDANQYVFWDAIHPTERMNHVISDYLMNTTLYVFL